MNLSEIHWPVFQLRNEKPTESNGVYFYAYENWKDEGDEIVKNVVVRIVDDTTISAPSLALRRLAIKSLGGKLFKITKALFFLGDLIKIATTRAWFIDSSGRIFQYTKNVRCKLVYRKILKLIPVTSGGAIIEVEGFAQRFKTLHKPEADKLYAGILLHGMSPILYGVYDQKYKDTWRMV